METEGQRQTHSLGEREQRRQMKRDMDIEMETEGQRQTHSLGEREQKRDRRREIWT